MNIEIFPCSGGMAEGFRRAGIRFDLAIDKDQHAVASYERNHHHRPIEMDVNDFARMVRAGWQPPESIDLFLADPPCTPYSRAGKRLGLEDERDCMLVTADLIKLLRPRAYLIGNVPGLQDSTSWHIVQDVIGGLAAHGYCVVDYASLDAADYGVPQFRVRPFWFGHLDGPCLRWPAPTHGAPTQQIAIGEHALLPWVTCRQALGHLPIGELGRPVRMKIRAKDEDGTRHGGDRSRCSEPDRPAKTVVAKADWKGGQILIPKELLAHEKHPCCTLDAPAKTVTYHLGATGAIQGGAALYVGEAVEHQRHRVSDPDRPSYVIKTGGGRASGNGSTMRLPDPNRPPAAPDEPHRALSTARDQAVLEWPWDRPATTIFADGERIMPPGHHSGSNLSGPNAVVLSARAAAILQGFPDGECIGTEGRCPEAGCRPGEVCPVCGDVRRWHFTGATKKAVWSQLGQAMPPGLAEAVARSVAEQMRAARADETTRSGSGARRAG